MNKQSDDSERALLLSPEPPYPLAGGGASRSASVLHFLADRFRTDLISFAEEGAPDGRLDLPPGLVERAVTVRLPRHSRSPWAKIGRNGARLLRGRPPLVDRFSQQASLQAVEQAAADRRYDLAIVEHFWCVDYLPILRRSASRVVLDLHNVESALHHACARSEPFPQNLAHSIFERSSLSLEQELLAQFDLVLTASESDAERVRAIAPGASVAVYPNAVPLLPRPEPVEENVIAFSGNLEYHPNVTAVKHFRQEIWPRIRKLDPELRWRLIGKNESAVRPWTAGDPRIEFTGPVDDAVSELARARFAVAPLLAGSGTRVKIMEAWAAGRAVLSTPIGAEGLPAVDGENLILAEGTAAWTEAARRLLNDSALRARLGEAGRNTYETECCWPAAWRLLDATIVELLGARSAACAT